MKDVSLIVYPAADVAKAKQFFRELIGADPYVDSPQYTGFKSGDMEIGIIPNRDQRQPAGIAYWTVPDIKASVKALVDAGGTVAQDVTDVGYGLLVASVTEPSGNIVGLRQMPNA